MSTQPTARREKLAVLLLMIAALLVATDIIQQIAEFVAFFLSELIILQRFLE